MLKFQHFFSFYLEPFPNQIEVYNPPLPVRWLLGLLYKNLEFSREIFTILYSL